jgi:hypothetical protein
VDEVELENDSHSKNILEAVSIPEQICEKGMDMSPF